MKAGSQPPTEARLAEALRERDEAIEAAARLRAELEALRLQRQRAGEPDPPLYPNTASPGAPPPLRYVVVDGVYGAVKGAVSALRRRLGARR